MSYALILFGILMRLIPHAPNFTPVAAIALFGGAILPGWQGMVVPLLLMIGSDIFLGFHGNVLWVYGSFLLVAWIGRRLGKDATIGWIGFGALSSSLLFFLITNIAVWLSPDGMYPKTFSGLMVCYMMAIPFFRNELLATFLYSITFFGVYRLAESWLQRRTKETVQV